MKFQPIDDNNPQFLLMVARYDEFPKGFRELLAKEAEWSKWFCEGPDGQDLTWYESSYMHVDGNTVIGLFSDLHMGEEEFQMMLQLTRGEPAALERIYARGSTYIDKDGVECISQLVCFDRTPSDPPGLPFLEKIDLREPTILCTGSPTDAPQYNSQDFYANLAKKAQR